MSSNIPSATEVVFIFTIEIDSSLAKKQTKTTTLKINSMRNVSCSDFTTPMTGMEIFGVKIMITYKINMHRNKQCFFSALA
ncbi:hypothetical protein [Dryocola clanedunensis]|uniref:hypothetical protein n=1 Tax=Cedecea sulfonylureivorans TaxID=3051154 RepID=UPI001F1915E0|nr:hypothetical protein [Cedecea sulfonylureivorans]